MKQGWEEKRLDEVYDVRDGTHYSPKFHPTGYPFVTSKNLKNGTLNFDKIQYISEKDYIEYNKRSKVDKGDILFAMIGTLGNPVVVEIEPDFAIKNVALIKVPKNQSNYFLKYYLDSQDVVDKIYRDARGTTQKFVGLGNLRKFKILLPPLSEQQRIVSVLDEAFASIAQAKSNAERNLVNARELFESLLNSVLTNSVEGWKVEKLERITTKIGSGATPLGGEKAYHAEGISLIRSLNVHDMGFRMKDLAFLDDNQADKLSNVTVESGDVLLNITGASVARCCIVPDDVLPARVNQHVSIIRLIKDEMLPEFLHYALISKVNKDKLLNTGEKGGSTRQALTKAQIEDFAINYPPLAEQCAIVGRLEALSAETKRLEAIYKNKVESLEELKKSVLGKAFSGEV